MEVDRHLLTIGWQQAQTASPHRTCLFFAILQKRDNLPMDAAVIFSRSIFSSENVHSKAFNPPNLFLHGTSIFPFKICVELVCFIPALIIGISSMIW